MLAPRIFLTPTVPAVELETQTVTDHSITQSELESRLWDAANALRGPVDAADFKSYVFPVLFLKWISDTWDLEHRKAVEDFDEDVPEEVEDDYHRFVVPDGCHWSDIRAVGKNVGAKLQETFDRLEQANPDKLGGIFGDVAWGNKERLPEHALNDLLKAFDRVTLNPEVVPHDLLGGAYEYLLRQFADASGKKAGEFFTPREIVRLLVKILDPQPEERVYDPACGTAGMLVETIGAVRESGGDHRTLRLYGQEVNLTTAAIARMNLYLHEIEDFQILRGDTLREPKFRKADGHVETFQVVITNPPFSLEGWGAEDWTTDARAIWGVPPQKNGDYAWIQHMVASMDKEDGRLGVVMPHGVLFRGHAEARIREEMVKSDLLEAVVGLPSNLFYNTSIPACLLIFRAEKSADRKEHVLFVDGSDKFQEGSPRNSMADADIDSVAEACRTGEVTDGEIDVQLRLVPHSKIEENGWDLNISRYIEQEADEAVDIFTALADVREAEDEYSKAQTAMWARLKEAGYELA